MRKAYLLIFLLGFCISLRAQHTVSLKPGDSLAEFKTNHVYKNPAFLPSRVIFKDGATTRANLNYNRLSDRMEFIDPKGDTLELTNNHLIKEVVIGESRFRYDEGFFELIKESGAVMLAMKKPIRLVGEKKVGAMGIASQTQAIETYQSLQDVSRILKLSPNVEHIFSVAPIFYFGNENSVFFPASQKNLSKILPGKKDQIAGYVKTNQVNFSKIEDILSLLSAIKAP